MSAVAAPGPIIRDVFGRLPDGRAVERLFLRGADGFEVAITTYGAAIQALQVRDRQGKIGDVVLGHDRLAPYLARRDFFGASIGRYANRIAGAAFSLDDIRHKLSANDGRNALHGGVGGFDQALWAVEAVGGGAEPFVTLRHISPNGADGFPGTLTTCLTYRITGAQELTLAFEARTDRPTVVNLTHHSFFNLGGVAEHRDVLDHELTLFAEHVLPIDAGLIPHGEAMPVADTPFDFRSPRPIGARIREAHEQLRLARGYDHCFVLSDAPALQPRLAARVVEPASGRVLELLTDQPGLQFYSGNFLDGTVRGKSGRLYRQSDAVCLEPQLWPDAPNRPDYPSSRLDPGQAYRHVSVFRFSTI